MRATSQKVWAFVLTGLGLCRRSTGCWRDSRPDLGRLRRSKPQLQAVNEERHVENINHVHVGTLCQSFCRVGPVGRSTGAQTGVKVCLQHVPAPAAATAGMATGRDVGNAAGSRGNCRPNGPPRDRSAVTDVHGHTVLSRNEIPNTECPDIGNRSFFGSHTDSGLALCLRPVVAACDGLATTGSPRVVRFDLGAIVERDRSDTPTPNSIGCAGCPTRKRTSSSVWLRAAAAALVHCCRCGGWEKWVA